MPYDFMGEILKTKDYAMSALVEFTKSFRTLGYSIESVGYLDIFSLHTSLLGLIE